MRLPISPPRGLHRFPGKRDILAESRAVRPTRNQAAYIAGSASSVSAVATIRPPMIATAIGPRRRCATAGSSPAPPRPRSARSGGNDAPPDSTTACRSGTPAARVLLDLVDQDDRVALIMPISAITPSSATKPKGRSSSSSAARHAGDAHRAGQEDQHRALEALQPASAA